jgi:hypothetical protein
MGCACKNKIKNIEKYADEGSVSVESKGGFLEKFWEILMRMALGILCGVVIIVVSVPLIIYLIICMMFGKGMHINLNKVRELKEKYAKKEG